MKMTKTYSFGHNFNGEYYYESQDDHWTIMKTNICNRDRGIANNDYCSTWWRLSGLLEYIITDDPLGQLPY